MSNFEDKHLTPKQASRYFNVSENTLRNWSNEGKVKCERTSGGHRRYIVPETKEVIKKKFIYARVSTKKQTDDLERQISFLKERYPDYEVVSDVGSGINYKRKGFISILEFLFSGDIEEVVSYSSDRFSRLGASDLFKWMFDRFGSKLTFVFEGSDDLEEGLTSDLMEVLTVFTARYNGRRKYKTKSKNDDVQSSEKSISEKE